MLTLVLGGISSGKSAFAVELARPAGAVLVLATGRVSDEEMEARIAAHRRDRPQGWKVIEEPLDLSGALAGVPSSPIVLLESVDSWLANVLEATASPEVLEGRCLAELDAIQEHYNLIAVSSEVGLAPVPLHPSGRAFAGLLGRVNQRLAASAGEVYLVVAGIPLPLHEKRGTRPA